MKRFSGFLLSVFMLAALTACNKTPKNDIPLQGMYAGTIPCSDCAGIQYAVTFNPDGTVVDTSLYENRDNASLSEAGTWKMDNGIVTATFPFDTKYFVIKSPDTIEMTNREGKRYDNMAERYMLKQVQPKAVSDFSGRYKMSGDESSNGNTQTLTIAGNAENGVSVSIAADGVKETCRFNGNGKIINDQIEVPLQTVKPNLKSTMVIRSSGSKEMNVFTSEADDSNDLGLFCSNGKTLAGDYVKTE